MKMSNPERRQETTIEGRVEILGDFPRGKIGDRNGTKRQVKHSGLFLKTKNAAWLFIWVRQLIFCSITFKSRWAIP